MIPIANDGRDRSAHLVRRLKPYTFFYRSSNCFPSNAPRQSLRQRTQRCIAFVCRKGNFFYCLKTLILILRSGFLILFWPEFIHNCVKTIELSNMVFYNWPFETLTTFLYILVIYTTCNKIKPSSFSLKMTFCLYATLLMVTSSMFDLLNLGEYYF